MFKWERCGVHDILYIIDDYTDNHLYCIMVLTIGIQYWILFLFCDNEIIITLFKVSRARSFYYFDLIKEKSLMLSK